MEARRAGAGGDGLTIPSALAAAVAREPRNGRDEWLRGLPTTVAEVARRWRLAVGPPYEPGGQTAWVAPATDAGGRPVVLKVGWRHTESLHEADGLRTWDGDPTVRLLDAVERGASTALLLERCEPGTPLSSRPVAEQDEVVAGLLRRLWRAAPEAPFRSLRDLCHQWAGESERDRQRRRAAIDAGLHREGMALFRSLADDHVADPVLLATDLHAGNVLAAERAPWLVVDPKPYVGDRHYDALQHLLNRVAGSPAEDPSTLARRMAALLDLDPDRLHAWFLARSCVEAGWDDAHAATARHLASA